MKLTTILSVGIALALPMCANTNKHRAPQRSTAQLEAAFRRKDKNSDGYLSRDEYLAKAKDSGKATRNFIKKDKNGDNRLTEQEFTTRLPKNW